MQYTLSSRFILFCFTRFSIYAVFGNVLVLINFAIFFFFSEKPNKIVIQRVGDRDAADHITASAGDDLEMECIATGGNPPPTLRWYMDDLEIRSGHTQENSRPSGNTVRTWTSISRLVLPVSKSDDGTTIRCKAEHPALQEPLSARKFLTIHCKLCSEYYIVFEY